MATAWTSCRNGCCRFAGSPSSILQIQPGFALAAQYTMNTMIICYGRFSLTAGLPFSSLPVSFTTQTLPAIRPFSPFSSLRLRCPLPIFRSHESVSLAINSFVPALPRQWVCLSSFLPKVFFVLWYFLSFSHPLRHRHPNPRSIAH